MLTFSTPVFRSPSFGCLKFLSNIRRSSFTWIPYTTNVMGREEHDWLEVKWSYRSRLMICRVLPVNKGLLSCSPQHSLVSSIQSDFTFSNGKTVLFVSRSSYCCRQSHKCSLVPLHPPRLVLIVDKAIVFVHRVGI